MLLLIILIAFAVGFLLDVVWALCVHAITKRQALRSANLSAVLYLCTVVSTILIVDKNLIAIAAYAVGSWLGSYIVVRRGK